MTSKSLPIAHSCTKPKNKKTELELTVLAVWYASFVVALTTFVKPARYGIPVLLNFWIILSLVSS